MNKFRIGDMVVVLKESSDSHLQGTVGTIVNIKSISSLTIYRVRAGIDDKEYEYFENEIGPINPNQKNNITNKEKNNIAIFKENDNLKLKNGKVGTVSKVIYEKVDEKDNYGLYAYQMIIDNQKCLIYPEQIDTKNE